MDEEEEGRPRPTPRRPPTSHPSNRSAWARGRQFFGTDSIVAVDGGDIVSTTARWLQVSTRVTCSTPDPSAPWAPGCPTPSPPRWLNPTSWWDRVRRRCLRVQRVRVRHPGASRPARGRRVGNDGVWNNIRTFHRHVPRPACRLRAGPRPTTQSSPPWAVTASWSRIPPISPRSGPRRASGKPALVDVHIAETMRMSSNQHSSSLRSQFWVLGLSLKSEDEGPARWPIREQFWLRPAARRRPAAALQQHDQGEGAEDEAVDGEGEQTDGLQRSQQEGDGEVARNRRHHHPDPHPRGDPRR